MQARTALVALLAIGASGCSPTPSTGPATGSPPPATPAASHAPAAATWTVTALPFPAGTAPCDIEGGGLQNLRVVGLGSGLLALGSCAHTTSPSLVWVSSDGQSWQASAPTALAHADIYALIVSDGLVVAAGQDTTDGFAAAAWTSRDGISWTRSTGDLGCGVMQTVTGSGSGLVAFGNRIPNVPEFEAPPGVCEWTSSDGVAWQAVPVDASTFSPTGGVASVAAGSHGLVAVGSDAGPTQSVAQLWQSPDASVWTRPDLGTMAGWLSLDTVLAGGPGFVAFGTNANGNVAVATSTDGVTWSPTPAPVQGTLDGGPSFGTASGGLVCAGVPINAVESAVMLWRSTDGVHWLAAPAPPAALNYRSVAATDNAMVLAATTADGHAAIASLGQ